MTDECPFCLYLAGRFDRGLIVYEDDHFFVVPSLHQKQGNLGHCLVITREHIRDLYQLNPGLSGPLLDGVAKAARTVKAAFNAVGTSIRQNNGTPAQDVFHLHFHVLPRYPDDTFDASEYQIIDEPIRLEQAKALRDAWR